MQSIKYDAIMMKEALLKGDIIKLAKILENTWESKKRMASSISNYEINMLFDLAIKNGAYSGKLSGAGGGGFMFFIVDPTKKLQLVHILNNQRGKVINFHFVKDGSRGWRV